jgi:hypothetical protein
VLLLQVLPAEQEDPAHGVPTAVLRMMQVAGVEEPVLTNWALKVFPETGQMAGPVFSAALGNQSAPGSGAAEGRTGSSHRH